MTTAAAFLAGVVAGGLAAGFAAWRLTEERTALYGRLFSFAMHEVNTPVTAVNMTIINLLSGVFGDVPPDQLKWIEMMRDQVGRLNALVGELRDLVHIELHRDLRTTVESVPAAEIVEDGLATLRRGFAYSDIELRVETADGLPGVRTDRDRAARTLSSLLFHARKFRLSGPVVLRASREAAFVVFTVDYAGQKLALDVVRRSLDLFYPARKRKDQILAATGLGLGLLRSVMRRIGGDVDLAVGPDGASRLTLRLPVEEAS